MANSVAMKAIIIIFFSSILFYSASTTNHTVGGATGWDVVSNLQNWTKTTTFYTGDNLEFVYGPVHDVLEVDEDSYTKCQTSKPIRTFNNGDTVIPLDKPGTRYFICGTGGHCESGLKVQVAILANSSTSTGGNRRPRTTPPHSPAPPRSPPTPRNPTPDIPDTPSFPISPPPGQHSASEVQYHIPGWLFSLPFIMILFLLDAPTLHMLEHYQIS